MENFGHFSIFALLNLCPLLLQHHQCCQSMKKLENYYFLLSISKILENLEHFSFFAKLNLWPLLLQHHQSCLRGRFHSRFLLAFLRPRWRRCPTAPLAFLTTVIAREKQRDPLGGGAIADGESRSKNVSGNGPLVWKNLRIHLFCKASAKL
jgi:hypothetical protein